MKNMSRLMSLCEFEEMQKYKMIIKREQKKIVAVKREAVIIVTSKTC